MRVLFVENDDSFSYNLLDLLPEPRASITVVRGGTPEAAEALPRHDAVVIGPGPTDPERAGLLGFVHAAAERRLPLLGVCLGHQALGMAFGARLVRSVPAHGKIALVTFAPSRRLPGIEGRYRVMRYHSLAIASVPPPLRVIATLSDRTVMGIEHRDLPMAGVQFHPDSYGTPHGRRMVEAFFRGLE